MIGWIAAAALVVVIGLVVFHARSGRPVPDVLRVGQTLPDFRAIDENGKTVHARNLAGSATVMIFVRGNWCPFCSKQVENLTACYKEIGDLGARLILVTPKPLETTRRVAEFFEVEFEFWLDESLQASRQLGLLLESGVPKDYYREYGKDTVWPTSLVIDASNVIRFVTLSKHIVDRTNPRTLLRELRSVIDG